MYSSKTKLILFASVIIFLAGVGATLGFWYQVNSRSTALFTLFEHKINQETEMHQAYSMDKGFYDVFFNGQEQKEQIKTTVSSVVVPHHLIAGQFIGSFFNSLATQDFDTVVIVGPNHKQLGDEVIIDGLSWQTPYGVVPVDKKLSNRIVSQNIASVNSKVMHEEHSISALVPFVKKTWPQANIVPIILKNNTSFSQLDVVANVIAQAKGKVLFIASVDFSHYLSQAVADFHDELSLNVLKSSSLENLPKTEVDSQPSLYMLLKYNEYKKSQSFTEVSHTNSAQIIGRDLDETTSHFIGYYTDGLSLQKPAVSVQFFGDVMLDRDVAKAMATSGLDYIFKNLHGQENRFFQGTHMLMANLEGPFAKERIQTSKTIAFRFDPILAAQLKSYNFDAFSLANNHAYDMGRSNVSGTRQILAQNNLNYFGDEYNQGSQYTYIAGEDQNLPFKIAFIGLNRTEGEIDMNKVKIAIEDAKNKAKFIIVNIHWGEEYHRLSNRQQQDLAHQLIDWGTDVIIGHHPHVVQEVEVYKGKYIFYSLGNFIFDQYFSKDTQEGMSVGLIIYDDGTIRPHILPFFSKKSQVQVMVGVQREKFLEWLQKNSRLDGKNFENI